MCSLEEANEAYRYIGLPGYNPHLKKDVFFKYFNMTEARDAKSVIDETKRALSNANHSTAVDSVSIDIRSDYFRAHEPSETSICLQSQQIPSDHDKVLLINARRVYHIAEEGRNYQEREELARTYFDQVGAVEQDSQKYVNGDLYLQIYIVNKLHKYRNSDNIYGFRPIKRNSFFFHRLLKNGYLCGRFKDLKKNIDWSYLPMNLPVDKEDIYYICSASYFRRNQRQKLSALQLKDEEDLQIKYSSDYNWIFWPDLD